MSFLLYKSMCVIIISLTSLRIYDMSKIIKIANRKILSCLNFCLYTSRFDCLFIKYIRGIVIPVNSVKSVTYITIIKSVSWLFISVSLCISSSLISTKIEKHTIKSKKLIIVQAKTTRPFATHFFGNGFAWGVFLAICRLCLILRISSMLIHIRSRPSVNFRTSGNMPSSTLFNSTTFHNIISSIILNNTRNKAFI